MAKERSYYVIFMITFMFYLGLMLTTQATDLMSSHFIVFLVLTSPLYCLQMIWLVQKSLVERLIKSANKVKPHVH